MNKEKLEKMYQNIRDEEAGENTNRASLEKKCKMLCACGRKGLIALPKGFWKNKCPNCGDNLRIEKWSDGGWPDYGDSYKYYKCSCGYEYGTSWIVLHLRNGCLTYFD